MAASANSRARLASTSRVMKDVVDPQQVKDAGELRELLAIYRDAEELVNIGAYRAGTNPRIDRALELIGPINSFLRVSTVCSPN